MTFDEVMLALSDYLDRRAAQLEADAVVAIATNDGAQAAFVKGAVDELRSLLIWKTALRDRERSNAG